MQAGQLCDEACLALLQQLRPTWIRLQEVTQGEASVSQVLHPICNGTHKVTVAPHPFPLTATVVMKAVLNHVFPLYITVDGPRS